MQARNTKIGFSIVALALMVGSCGNAKNAWYGLIMPGASVQSKVTGPFDTIDQCRAATLPMLSHGARGSCSEGCKADDDSLSQCRTTIDLN